MIIELFSWSFPESFYIIDDLNRKEFLKGSFNVTNLRYGQH